MSTPAAVDYSTLRWVGKELDETLSQAVDMLQRYSEDGDDGDSIEQCAGYLHQVYGIVQILELNGAAMLVEEMEGVAAALAAHRTIDVGEALEALMRAILQMRSYLQRLQRGQEDAPLLILPLVNDLRAAYGRPIIAESALFAPDLEERSTGEELDERGMATAGAAALPRYQRGLLRFLRGLEAYDSAARMRGAIAEVEASGGNGPAGEPWRIAVGLLDAIASGELEAHAAAVRHLLTRFEQSLRQGARQQAPPVLDAAVQRGALYYIARVAPATERLGSLQQHYRLSELLDDEQRLEQVRDGMFDAGSEAFASVSAAIRDELASVKDSLDLYVRGDARSADELTSIAEALERTADTLGVLGLAQPRTVVLEQVESIRGLMSGPADASTDTADELAAALLYVESSLTDLDARAREAASAAPAAPAETAFGAECEAVVATSLSEVISELRSLKEDFVHLIESQDPASLTRVDSRLGAIAGALDILELERAGVLLNQLRGYVSGVLEGDHSLPEGDSLDACADLISSVEYYLESVSEGRSNAAAILDDADHTIVALGGESLLAGSASEPPTSEVAGEDAAASGAPADWPADAEQEPAAEHAAEPPSKATRVDMDVPLRAPEMDEEILEIFIEEADEVLATLREVYPRWRSNPEDQEALVTCRRMFHTVKGSGRLAGALLLGELGWSMENLLNGLLERDLSPSPAIHDVVADGITAISELVGELRGEGEPATDVRAVMSRAVELSEGRSPEPRSGETLGEVSEPQTRVGTVPPFADPLEDAASDSDDGSTVPAASPADSIEWAGEEAADAEDDEIDDAFAAQLDDTRGGVLAPEEAAAMDVEGLPTDTESPLEEAPAESNAADSASGAELAANTDDQSAPARIPSFDGALAGSGIETEQDALAAPQEPEPEATIPPQGGGSPDVADPPRRPVLDPTLYEIFSAECAEHLDTVGKYLHDYQPGDEAGTIPRQVVRSLHTLAGSAHMAGLSGLAGLGHALESLMRAHQNRGTTMEAPEWALLRRGMAEIEAFVYALGDEHRPLPDLDPITEEAAAAQPVPPAPSLEVQAWSQDSPDEPASPGAPVDPSASPEAAAPDEHAAASGTALASPAAPDSGSVPRLGPVPPWPVEPTAERGADAQVLSRCSMAPADYPVAQPDGVTAGANTIDLTGSPLAEASGLRPDDESVAAPAPQPAGDSAEAALPSVDDELVALFLEEAAELLGDSEQALQQWRDGAEQGPQVESLQRVLHTLKGGARMAGATPMAELAHTMETALERLEEDNNQADVELLNLLDTGNDRLIAQRDAIEAGKPPGVNSSLIAAFNGYRHGEAPAPDEPDPVAPSIGEREAGTAAPAAPADTASPASDAGTNAVRSDEVIRVQASLLNNLVNHAGEISIYRARLEQQAGAVGFNLEELGQTVARLRDQLRSLEIDTEAQILYRTNPGRPDQAAGAGQADAADQYAGEFDPLEMDRFTRLQELSRSLSESASDLSSIQENLETHNRESETLLLQQSRVSTDLQDGLMRTRMVAFASLVPRLRRVVRQTSQELGKQAAIKVLGAEGEMDRTLLDGVVPALEHMLRNAVAHGIEAPHERAVQGKPQAGTINLSLSREGADVVIRVADDGGGMDLSAIRRKAVSRGLMSDDAPLTDREITRFVLESGFSTAETVTQIAGRGVGMDVVHAEIKQLGGSLDIETSQGAGTAFTVRLPFTLALNQALLCRAGDEVYALPLSSVEGVVRIEGGELQRLLGEGTGAEYEYAGLRYAVRRLSTVLGGDASATIARRAPLILVHAGDHRLALHVDGLMGSREIVVKSVGSQISTVPGILGATILADGRVVLILDVGALVRFGVDSGDASDLPLEPEAEPETPYGDDAPEARGPRQIMVVDDSITMRRVATRLLERNDYSVITAKDGVEAVSILQEQVPDAVLLDIEMPRMDGYELATHMRNEANLRDVPIVMVTSRAGEKHRQRALEAGIDHYVGKPYQEGVLLTTLHSVIGQKDLSEA